MARLTRKNIKVFAGNATNNGVFGSLQAENPVTTTNVEQIQSLPAWNVGWDSATMTSEKLPPLEEFQGIQYVTTYQQAYLMQEGMPEWASTVTYYKGSLAKEVTSNGFRIYCSLTDNNENHLLSDTSNWKKIMDSQDLYAFDNSVVHKAGNETITGTKTFEVNGASADAFVIKNKAIDLGTIPSNNIHTRIYFKDKNGDNAACLYSNVSNSGDNSLMLKATKNDGNNELTTMGLVYPSSGNPYAFAPTPTDTTSINSTHIATVGWVNSVGNNVVHKTGNETITGAKTFTNSMITQNISPKGNITLGTSTNTWGMMVNFQDTTGKRIARIQPMAVTTTNNRVGMWVNNADNTVEKGIYVDSDGTTSAPTPSAGDNSTKIATTAFVKAQGYAVNSNVVHLTSNEIINGVKRFFGEITRANQNITKGTAPSSAINTVIIFTDKDGKQLGDVYHRYEANKNSRTILQATKANASGNTDTASISICYPASGNPYGEAPASDVNGSILTTVDKSKSQNGYFKLGNGLIVQWGRVTASNVALTITLPTAFSSATSYSISAITNNGKAAFTQAQTSTTFHLDASGGIGSTSLQWIAIGY